MAEEAAVIRRIFEMAAAGTGYQRIAHRLNEERVPAPVPRRRGRPRGWAPSTIREMLFRELYRGVIVWNRTERIILRGGHHKRARAAVDWLRLDAPALRIVSEALWVAAQARLAGTRATYLHTRNGHAGGRPVNGAEGRYLLTGLGQCGVCGAGMFVHTRGPWRRGAPSYGCMAYHTRGRVVCPNNLEVPLVAADQAVLTETRQPELHRYWTTRDRAANVRLFRLASEILAAVDAGVFPPRVGGQCQDRPVRSRRWAWG